MKDIQQPPQTRKSTYSRLHLELNPTASISWPMSGKEISRQPAQPPRSDSASQNPFTTFPCAVLTFAFILPKIHADIHSRSSYSAKPVLSSSSSNLGQSNQVKVIRYLLKYSLLTDATKATFCHWAIILSQARMEYTKSFWVSMLESLRVSHAMPLSQSLKSYSSDPRIWMLKRFYILKSNVPPSQRVSAQCGSDLAGFLVRLVRMARASITIFQVWCTHEFSQASWPANYSSRGSAMPRNRLMRWGLFSLGLIERRAES